MVCFVDTYSETCLPFNFSLIKMEEDGACSRMVDTVIIYRKLLDFTKHLCQRVDEQVNPVADVIKQ